MSSKTPAWLFDAYPDARRSSLIVWVKRGSTVERRLVPYRPEFAVAPDAAPLSLAEEILADDPRVEKTWRDVATLWLRGPQKPVLRVRPRRLQDLHAVATDLRKKTRTKGFLFFDVDHAPESRWMHEQHLFSM
ncbi:MAG: hypothetical protein ACT4PT_09565, partial [Methanobacteriota archaeon]